MLRVIATAATACLLCNAALAAAQDDPHAAQPERPTVATHAGTVAAGWVEVEAGVEFDRYDDASRGGSAPLLVKMGLRRRLQLNVSDPVAHPPGADTTGTGDLAVGVKWRLADKARLLGRFAVLPSLKLKTGSTASGAGTGTTDVGLLLISSHDFGAVSMDVNVGYTRRSGTGALAPRQASLWTTAAGGPIRGAVGWTAELYGYPGTRGPAGARPIVAVLFGPTFTARKWLVIDAGAIAPLRGPQPRALYTGFVYNVGRLWHARLAAAGVQLPASSY